jgi:hypothetical protein
VVEPFEAGDDEFIARRRAIGAIRKFGDGLTMDSALTTEALQRILEVVDREKAAAGKQG